MDEKSPMPPEDDLIDLGKYWRVLRPNLWKVALFSLAVGVLTLLVLLQMPNIYQATAVIAPPADDRRQNPALGALASFGISVGGPSRVEDLESLFKSGDLAARVFNKYKPWPILFGDRYDPQTGGLKASSNMNPFGGENKKKPLGDWDAIRAAKDRLKVVANRKSNTVSISFESPSAEGSANFVRYFLEEGKSRLQEEALDRATKNNKFIEEQIRKTTDAITRDRLYTLFGQETEREMLARNREQFGFRVIDSPRAPDRKSGPKRGSAAVAATLSSGFVIAIYFMTWNRRRRIRDAERDDGDKL